MACLLFVDMAAAEKKQDSEWKELIGDHGLKYWGLVDPDAEGTADWKTSGSVALHADNPKLLQYAANGSGIIVNGPTGKTENLMSSIEFGDIELHVEFLISQESNSGIYFMGRYEIQVKDTWGKDEIGPHDSGAIYQRWDPERGEGNEGYDGHPPRVSACRKPGEWESFDVIFRAPKFDPVGNKTQDAEFEKVVQNGILIHEHATISGPTRAAVSEDESPTGPLLLQGDHGPVAYRNLRIRSLD
jgi:hypothetical protein